MFFFDNIIDEASNSFVRIWKKTKRVLKNFLDFLISPINPVTRHRFLYGWRWGWLLYSTLVTITVVGILYFTSNHIGLKSSDILGQEPAKETNLFWALISQFVDPGNLPLTKKEGGAIAFICAVLGIICLSGLLVSSLVSFISRRSDDWIMGLIHYNGFLSRLLFFKNYVVIIGVNEQTASIVKSSLQKKNIKYVLIQSCQNIEKVRLKLNLSLDKVDEERVVFYHGERTSEEDIDMLRLEDSSEVYILGEDIHSSSESDHDSYNMSCLELVAKYMDRHMDRHQTDERLKCHVNFEYQSTFMAFKFTHIYRSLNEKIEFLPFNVHEIWAKKILVDNFAIVPMGKHGAKNVIRYKPVDSFLELDSQGKKHEKYIDEDSEQTVHIIIVGMNQMGVALAMQAALLIHLPNYHKDNKRTKRTTITFIDNNAVKEGEYLRGRYSSLFELCRYRTIICGKHTFDKNNAKGIDEYDISWIKAKGDLKLSINEERCDWIDPMKNGRYSYIGDNFMDLQWEFIEGNIANADIQNYLSVLTEDDTHRTCTVAICLNNPQQSIAAALYLPETVLKRALQILVYQQDKYEIINSLATSEKEWKRYEKLKPFGMIEGCYTSGIFDNVLAKLSNLIYEDATDIRSSMKLSYDSKMDDTLHYRAKRLWNELGIVYKLANINLVDSFPMKLRSIGLNIDKVLDEKIDDSKKAGLVLAEHNRWLTERLTMGFRPLDEKELSKILDGDKIWDKEYLKNKSRAHVDICPIEKIKEWDKSTYDKKIDEKIISMIPTMIKWEQWVLLRNIFLNKGKDVCVEGIMNDIVQISPSFGICRHLITKKQWECIMGYLPKGNDGKKDNSPVVNVSKYDVDSFILVLNKVSGLHFHLPTEQQWRIAKNQSNRHTGKDPKLKNMEGYVWQWTDSKQGDSSYKFCGRSRLFRKYKWNRDDCYWLPSFKSTDLGFRLVLLYNIDNVVRDEEKYKLEDDDTHVIDDLKRSLVKISDENDKTFWILPNPVTQRQWKAVMRNENLQRLNPSEHRGDYYPVEQISFKDAQLFVDVLNRITGMRFRIPEETEWLTASDKANAKEQKVWHNGIVKSTHRVQTKFAKGEVYNMYGNVWEWCDTWYEGDASGLSKKNSKRGVVKVLKGGSWRFSKDECLSEEHNRSYWLTDYKSDDVGFRIVISDSDFTDKPSEMLSDL